MLALLINIRKQFGVSIMSDGAIRFIFYYLCVLAVVSGTVVTLW